MNLYIYIYTDGETNDEVIPYCVKGGIYLREAPLSLIHSSRNSSLYKPESYWRWSIATIDDDHKFGVYIARSSAPRGTRKWKRIVNDAWIVEFDLNSHSMMEAADRNWRMCHSVRLFMMDNYSQTKDEWIVTFTTKGITGQEMKRRNITNPRNQVPRSIVSRTNFEGVRWYW